MGMICYNNVLKCANVDMRMYIFQNSYVTNILEKYNMLQLLISTNSWIDFQGFCPQFIGSWHIIL